MVLPCPTDKKMKLAKFFENIKAHRLVSTFFRIWDFQGVLYLLVRKEQFMFRCVDTNQAFAFSNYMNFDCIANASFYPRFTRKYPVFKFFFFSTGVSCYMFSMIRSIVISIADHSYSQNVLRNGIVAPNLHHQQLKWRVFMVKNSFWML